MDFKNLKIALVLDWTTTEGGAVKVDLELLNIFKHAEIFTSVYNPKKVKGFENYKVNSSFINRLPFAKTKYTHYLSLMPYAYELFDLSKFDIVISSSHSCSKGVITKPETMHVCYCHSPMRYAWDDWHNYINNYKTNPLFKLIAKKQMHKIRMWDRLAADRVDYFIANSNTVKKRISKYYSRESKVIFPMIDKNDFKEQNKKEDYFLAVGRMTPYKKFDLIVDTFNELDYKIKIAGTGVQFNELKSRAKDNVEMLGFVSDEEVKRLYANARGFIFPQLEDFGITPLEAMASGTPVIAFNKGGSRDTVVEGKTGIFFENQTKESLKKAIEKFLKIEKQFDSKKLRKHAETFDKTSFHTEIKDFIGEKWEKWKFKA